MLLLQPTPISVEEAYQLRAQVFGKSKEPQGRFNDAWLQQGFFFRAPSDCKAPSLASGLVQLQVCARVLLSCVSLHC